VVADREVLALIEQAAGEVTGWVNVCHQSGEDDL